MSRRISPPPPLQKKRVYYRAFYNLHLQHTQAHSMCSLQPGHGAAGFIESSPESDQSCVILVNMEAAGWTVFTI